jgi:Ca2+-binding EF-hand superfamily protein
MGRLSEVSGGTAYCTAAFHAYHHAWRCIMNFNHRWAACTMFVLLTAVSAAAQSDGAGLEREMQMMDADHDGKISATEHASGARKMFLTMDANHDGKVTAAEMDAAHQAITGRPSGSEQRSSASKINVIDADKDGQLTAQEHEQGSKRMFAIMDADLDGQLTAQEIQAGNERMRKY